MSEEEVKVPEEAKTGTAAPEETKVPAAEETPVQEEKKPRSKLKTAAVIMLIAEAVSMIGLLAFVAGKGVLPGRYLAVAGAVFAAAAAVSVLLIVFNINRKKGRYILSIVLSAVFAAFCIFGIFFLNKKLR